jgi:hypothetical protein
MPRHGGISHDDVDARRREGAVDRRHPRWVPPFGGFQRRRPKIAFSTVATPMMAAAPTAMTSAGFSWYFAFT